MSRDISNIVPQSGRFLDDLNKSRSIIEYATGAPKVITTDHALIHKGYGFSISGIFTSVANGATVNYAFKTPTVASGKYIHLKYKEFQCSANKFRIDLNEAPTNAPTSGGTLVPYNRRRVGTPNVSSMQAVKSAMTIDLTGVTVISTEQYIASVPRNLDLEWVLKQDTWYIRTLTNGSGSSADVSFFEFWYEEDLG